MAEQKKTVTSGVTSMFSLLREGSGTSMATPAVAGIYSMWLFVCGLFVKPYVGCFNRLF